MSEAQTSDFEYFDNSLESIANLYHDTKSADVHFTFESSNKDEVTRIGAHQNLLGAASDVFRAMFYGELKESAEIRVVDTSDAAFKEFLQYFYQRRVKLTIENVTEVMYLGHKYNVPKCVTDCIEFIKSKLNNENACTGLFYAILYDHTQLRRLCKEHIICNTEAIFKTLDFLHCDRQVLDYMLKLDFVSCSEDKVFEACMAWVKANSGESVLTKEIVDTHLGDLFYKIRYASMTIQQLCALQMKYESVLSNEFITIVNIIAQPGIQADKFVTTRRQIKWSDDSLFLEFDRKSSQNLYPFDLYPEYKTRLSSTVPIIFGSFTCSAIMIADGSGGHDLDWNLSVGVKITETSDGESSNVLLKMTAILGSTMTTVQMPQAILIRPGFVYTICFGPFPCEHRCRSHLLKKQLKISSGIVIEVRDDRFGDDEEDDDEDAEVDSPGLISELGFNFM